MTTLTVHRHSSAVAACTALAPTRLEALVLRVTAQVAAVVEHRMLRRAERAASALRAGSALRAAQDAAGERRRDAAAAHLLGLHPR